MSDPRRRMRAEDRREQILDLTLAIVDAEGFHAATLNRIAAEAGVTRTVIYQQFGDLPALFVALVDREAERASAHFTESALAATRPDEHDGVFAAAFAGFLHAVDAHPATFRLLLFPPQGAPARLHARLAEAEAIVLAYLERGLVDVAPALPDPEYTARVLHVAGRELLRLRLSDPAAATHERLLAHARRLTPASLRQADRSARK